MSEQNNSKKAYQLVKDLTSEKWVEPQLSRISLGNVFQESKRFSAEYCSELYIYESYGDNTVLDQPILREEVEVAVAALKKEMTSRTYSSRRGVHD